MAENEFSFPPTSNSKYYMGQSESNAFYFISPLILFYKNGDNKREYLNIFSHIPSQVFCSTDGNTTLWY